jgi:hypothetical protein
VYSSSKTYFDPVRQIKLMVRLTDSFRYALTLLSGLLEQKQTINPIL